MNPEIKKFTYKIILLSTILLIFGSAVFYSFLKEYYFPAFPYMFPTFILISVISHHLLTKAANENQQKFNTAFMLSFIVKLFAYSIFVAISLYIDKTNYISFVISLMTMYATYTVFDTVQILKILKKVNSDIQS